MTELAQLAPYATGAAVYLLSVGWLHVWTRFWGWVGSPGNGEYNGGDILADLVSARLDAVRSAKRIEGYEILERAEARRKSLTEMRARIDARRESLVEMRARIDARREQLGLPSRRDMLRASRQHEFPGARYDPLSPRRPPPPPPLPC